MPRTDEPRRVEKVQMTNVMITPGKINMEPENGPLECVFPLQPSGLGVMCWDMETLTWIPDKVKEQLD